MIVTSRFDRSHGFYNGGWDSVAIHESRYSAEAESNPTFQHLFLFCCTTQVTLNRFSPDRTRALGGSKFVALCDV